MKKNLSSFTMLLSFSQLMAQLPVGSNGQPIYQKGECKVIIPTVSYKCIFCEDKELTKNCKEYNCSLTDCTEAKTNDSKQGDLQKDTIRIEGKLIKMETKEDSIKTEPEKTDLTPYFNRQKNVNGTVLIYELKGGYKIYATYKNSRLTTWYSIGPDGKKIKPSASGITPVSCEDCLLLPDGRTVCKRCTTTPLGTPPVKMAS